MKLIQRFTRRKPLPVRAAGGLARRVGRVATSVARLVTSPIRR